MSETAILSIQIIGAIVGILVFLFAFIRYVLPIACRYLVKPRIKTKISLGKEIDVDSPLTKEKVKLFTARESSIWLCTNRNIELSSVTFRRLCQYQKNCMLYRFLLKSGLLRDKKWCSCASVDDWVYTDTFICPTDEAERKRQSSKHFIEGRLTLNPKENRIVKDSWVVLDMPLRLRDNKLHFVELTLSFRVRSEDTPFLNRLVNRVLNSAGREITYSYSEQRKIYISCEDKKEARKERETTDRVARDIGYRVALSYHGWGKVAEYQEIMGGLVSGIQFVLKKVNPPNSKVPAYELRNAIKEKFPKIETVFTQPPDGIYYTANEEALKIIYQKIWPNVREFVLKFLNCEGVSQLCSHSMRCFPLLPEILSMAYKYLVIASENSIASIAVNISNRSNMLAIALVHAVYSEFKIRVQMARQKRAIRKRVDKMANYFNLAKSKS